CIYFMFFFSSRRRHTRFSRDWSSDVCSSDLIGVDFEYFETLDMEIMAGRVFSLNFPADTANAAVLNETAVRELKLQNPIGAIIRSEERRVGKESRLMGMSDNIGSRLVCAWAW